MSKRYGNLIHQWHNMFDVAALAETGSRINQWFDSEAGNALLQGEIEALSQLSQSCVGHRCLTLSVADAFPQQVKAVDSVNSVPEHHLHHFSLSPVVGNLNAQGALANFDQLPLPSDTVDSLFLHHVLEFSPSPHDVLNEAARVLSPAGHMVVFVFNPMSLFGFSKWPMRAFTQQVVWRHHSLRMYRVLDWLRLLNLEPLQAMSGGYTWRLSRGHTLPGAHKSSQHSEGAKMVSLPICFGSFYAILATKHVSRLTPIKPPLWNALRSRKPSKLKVVNNSSAHVAKSAGEPDEF